jgi:hypothetical protein
LSFENAEETLKGCILCTAFERLRDGQEAEYPVRNQ